MEDENDGVEDNRRTMKNREIGYIENCVMMRNYLNKRDQI